MLIGVETSGLFGHITGTGRYVRSLLDTLKITGNQVITFSPASYRNRYINKLSKNYYRQFRISGKMRRSQIDCAIFPDYFLPLNFDLPAAIVIHDLSFITHPEFYSKSFVRLYKEQMEITLKKNPIIITVSEYSKHQINKHLNISMNDIYIVQGFIDDELFKPSAKRNEMNPYFLYTGHIEPRKNLDFMIKNFLQWKEKRKADITLKIVGKLWIKSTEVISMYNKHRENPDIEFTGYVPDERLNEYYKNAAGFVHTSLEEGFGYPVLEAMHYQLPIICSESISTSEISGTESIKINPREDASLLNGLDILYDKFLINEKIQYNIPYSPRLMEKQLRIVLNRLNEKTNSKIVHYYTPVIAAGEAIEKTLVYSKIFNSGINKRDLPGAIFDAKINEDQLNSLLLKLTYEGKIINTVDYVKLAAEDNGYYEQMKPKMDPSTTGKILKIIDLIPFISSVSFSGGTAHYGIEGHDDIDLFIITKANTVYIVYAIIHLMSLLFGVRSRLCANYLIDESDLKLNDQRDFYTAHQIISLKPYRDKGSLQLFLFRNGWINYFFPNFEIKEAEYRPRAFRYKIFIPLNKLIKNLYKFHYRIKIKNSSSAGSLRLTDHRIKLHTNDNRERIVRLFNEAWKEYRLSNSDSFDENYSIKSKAL